MLGSLIFAFLMTSLVLLAFWISGFMTKRATSQVIGIFCRNKALQFQGAKSIDELGLRPPDLLQRLTRLRDYRPYALKFFIDKGIVKVTSNGKLYLVEEKLNRNLRCKES